MNRKSVNSSRSLLCYCREQAEAVQADTKILILLVMFISSLVHGWAQGLI